MGYCKALAYREHEGHLRPGEEMVIARLRRPSPIARCANGCEIYAQAEIHKNVHAELFDRNKILCTICARAEGWIAKE